MSALALEHVSVVTGDARGTVVRDSTVLVGADGTIEQVAPDADVVVPPGYGRRDLTGRYVVPGLINAHAHLFADGRPLAPLLTRPATERLVAAALHSPVGAAVARRRTRANVLTQLRSGVTTVRSLGDVGFEVVRVRAEIERGERPGPRILASGPLMAVPGGHGAPQIALTSRTPEEARAHVRRSLARGATAIKIAATGGVTDARELGHAGRPEMSEAQMSAICAEAHAAGVVVAAHAQSPEGVAAALRAGVDTIEHGSPMTSEIVDLFHANPRSLRGWSAMVPTLLAALPLVRLDRSVTGVSEVVRANGEMVLDGMLQGVRDAATHGVTLGMGTDSALTYATHYDTWREVDLLVRYGGLTPAAALHAATQANARILGLEGVTGAIEPGRSADLVVLRGNPLDGARAFVDPEAVLARGAWLDRPRVERFAELEERLDGI